MFVNKIFYAKTYLECACNFFMKKILINIKFCVSLFKISLKVLDYKTFLFRDI